MSNQKFPSAWLDAGTSKPTALTAATPVEAHWWEDLSEESKEEYVAEHPHSKYADMHRQSKEDKKNAPVQKHGPAQVTNKPKPAAEHAPADHKPAHQPSEHAPAHEPSGHGDKSKAAHESLKSPELAAKSPFRKHLADYLKSRPKAIISHLKNEAKEFKAAGHALAGLARGKPLDDHGKKALASVAADLAIITATLVTGGHAAHGLAAFFAHGGVHLAQDCMIKSAVKGAVHHASVVIVADTSDDGMDAILKRAVAMMAEVIESGDLQKYVDAADKDEGAAEAPSDQEQKPIVTTSKVMARIDMSADVAGKGLCPECKKPMDVVTSGTSKMWACAADRISFPVPNGYGA